uniref:Insulin-like domain-containing protein n=1 Tax=Panagrellus redivivus TaxID=6233 RepID=A0A7E4VJH4_PANRE
MGGFRLFNRHFANLDAEYDHNQPRRDELLPNRQIRRTPPIKRCGIVFKKYLKAHCNDCLKDPGMAPISKRTGYEPGRGGPGIGTICCVMGCYDDDLDIYCCVDPKTPKN